MRASFCVVVVLAAAGCLSGCASKPKPAPYHVPKVPELGRVEPAQSSPVRVIFIRPEAARR